MSRTRYFGVVNAMTDPETAACGLSMRAPLAHTSETGLFITFEGGDGGGKTTQIELLRSWLCRGASVLGSPQVVVTKEPGGTELGAHIRELILHSPHVDDRAEALLYAADRGHHVRTTIAPALRSGAVVISDRYFDSSLAYQGAGRKLDVADVEALSLWAVDGLIPHITFLLDVDPQVLASRRDSSLHDRLERAGLAFHAAVREAFLDRARAHPNRFVVIDAGSSITEVHEQIKVRLVDWLRASSHTLLPLDDPAGEATP